MTSIRTRITSAVVGCTALVVAVAALIVGTTAQTMLVQGLDDRLRARARWMVTVFRPPQGSPAPEGRDGRNGRDGRDGSEGREGRDARNGGDSRESQLPPELQQTSLQYYFETRDVEKGEEIQRSQSLPEGTSLASFGAKPGDPIRTIRLPDGRPFRLLAMESVVRTWGWPRDGGRGSGRDGSRDGGSDPPRETPAGESPPRERHVATSWLALDASDIEEEGRHLAWILAAVWAGATVLAWAVSVKLSAAVLRPVDSLSRTIASLSPTSLSSRVPMAEVPPELSTVIARLNELIDKLETAFRRERASIANMAHELRNPISALRTTIEFGLYQELPAHGRQTLESSLALALRMQSLVNGLLTLTRIEAGQEILARKEVDLVQVLRDAWSTVEARARERGLTATWSLPESLPLVTSPPHLELVAANLLDNAVSHGAAPGDVSIELERDDAHARLRITNACADSTERAGFFEPFWRSDPARSGARHFGLGLALCDRVVGLLGGTIEAHQAAQRFAVTVKFPAARVPSEAAPVA